MVTTEKKEEVLFDKLGGKSSITAVVDTFYELVLNHPDVAPFFAETNMKKQKLHQANFISFALGGPNEYTGRGLREAHANMGLTELEFNVIAQLLAEALKKHGVGDDDIKKALEIVGSTKNDVLNL